jgi:biotin carboxyl carrier protein
MMRRYTLNIGSREFVVDVQEVDADQFEVTVGDESYAVILAEDQAMGGTIAPAPQVRAPQATSAAAPVASAAPATPAAPKTAPAARKPAGGGGKGALKAPMPGVILEVNVKAGDKVTRGQQVAILDAMKMHNVVGAPREGTIAEVCVDAGQTVGHGDVIVTFKED